jgi:hypothetical protein
MIILCEASREEALNDYPLALKYASGVGLSEILSG